MKQVLVLAETYDPFQDGVAKAAQVTAVGFAARGYQVTVGTGYHRDRPPDPPGANPAVRQFKVTGTANWRQGFYGEVTAYQEFVAGFRGDFILCHAWQAWTTDLALPLLRNTPARVIMVSHGFNAHRIPWHRRFPWGLGQWVGWLPYVLRLPWFLKKFSRVVFVSQRVDRHRFFDHGVAKLIRHPGVAVIPNSADPEEFNRPQPDFRTEFGLGNGCLFLCVANYFSHKNQELALRAFHRASLAGATLVFVGSEFTDYQRHVQKLDEELARLYPGGRVVFLEKLNRNQTLAAFQACDVFVLTSRGETQPIALIEAMACGKPFISTRSSGCIAEFAGGLIADTEQKIGEQMNDLAGNADVRRALGQAGREMFLASYTTQRTVDAFEELLH